MRAVYRGNPSSFPLPLVPFHHQLPVSSTFEVNFARILHFLVWKARTRNTAKRRRAKLRWLWQGKTGVRGEGGGQQQTSKTQDFAIETSKAHRLHCTLAKRCGAGEARRGGCGTWHKVGSLLLARWLFLQQLPLPKTGEWNFNRKVTKQKQCAKESALLPFEVLPRPPPPFTRHLQL